jgi:hypothetical protein
MPNSGAKRLNKIHISTSRQIPDKFSCVSIVAAARTEAMVLVHQWRTQEFSRERGGEEGGSTNSIEDRGHKEWRSGGGSPLVRGYAQFENE